MSTPVSFYPHQIAFGISLTIMLNIFFNVAYVYGITRSKNLESLYFPLKLIYESLFLLLILFYRARQTNSPKVNILADTFLSNFLFPFLSFSTYSGFRFTSCTRIKLSFIQFNNQGLLTENWDSLKHIRIFSTSQ